MSYLNTAYATRVGYYPSKKEKIVNDGKSNFHKYLNSTPTKEIIEIGEEGYTEEYFVSIQTSRHSETGERYEKIILADLDTPLGVGVIFKWQSKNNHWIIITKDIDSIETHFKGKIRECNHILNWNGYSCHAHIVTNSIRAAGLVESISSSLAISEPGLRVLAVVPKNEITLMIKREQRFLFENTAWRVISIDDVSSNNLRIIRFTEDIIDRSRDDLSSNITIPYAPPSLGIFGDGDN